MEKSENIKKKITIKDVAQRASVSTASVSYVLNEKTNRVSADTVDKVRQAVKDLNYIPNFSARSLVSNHSMLIGVIIPQTEDFQQLVLENPFYSEIVSGIEAKLRESGYHFILSGIDKGKSYLDLSVQRNLDGAIIMGIYQEQFYEELKDVKIPIVLIDSYVNDGYFQKIGNDDELGGYMATKYLIDNGHRNIALVTGSIRKDGVVERRYQGYKKALKEAGIFYNPEYVLEGSASYTFGYEQGKFLCEQLPNVTAVFTTADMMAFGLIRGLMETGKQVPEDISVIGFDDISLSSIFLPQLTTVNQKIKEKGGKAAELLIQLITDSGKSKQMVESEEDAILLPLEIIERNTVKSLNTK